MGICVWCLAVVRVLDAITKPFKLIANGEQVSDRLVHLDIVHLQVFSDNLTIPIHKFLEEVLGRDAQYCGVLVSELFDVDVFDHVDNLIILCLIHCSRIVIELSYLIMFLLWFIVMIHDVILWHCGIYSWFRGISPHPVGKGHVKRRLHDESNTALEAPTLQRWGRHCAGVYLFCCLIYGFPIGLPFNLGYCFDG